MGSDAVVGKYDICDKGGGDVSKKCDIISGQLHIIIIINFTEQLIPA